MQRKACFPVANCSIKMPDSTSMHAPDTAMSEDDSEQQQRRQQLINFGHTQWGFNNWSWTVTKQELDFVDFANGKYSAGVVAFVSITVKSVDIHRENIGYAISVANNKGFAIYKSRKCAVTNALRETLLSFGGSVATELMEILETHKSDVNNTNVAPPEPLPENNQNISNKPAEPKNSPLNKNIRKDSSDSCGSNPANNMRLPHQAVPPVVKNAVPPPPPPVAKALPMPASLPPAANRPPLPANAPRPPPPAAAPAPPHVRPNSNELLEGLNEEEARAERKRRQRLAQEEFRQKQLSKQKPDGKQDLSKNCTIDNLLLDIPTQDIVIEESGDAAETLENGKRKSPVPEGNTAKRRASFLNKLDVVQSE
ncbi:uncharacterized protein ACR2FA_006696 isoform 2-T2 [Aphomia sociella]